jgi:hypothetical protein
VRPLAVDPTGPTTSAPGAVQPPVVLTAPAAGTALSAGAPVTLAAQLSQDLTTVVQAGGSNCYFFVGDDAGSTATGVLDSQHGTCSATWTYRYSGTFSVSAAVTNPAAMTYTSAPVSVTVAGSSNPRCTADVSAPTTCVYRWTEVFYTSATAWSGRVCSIDGGCQWQTAHTSWAQVPGKDAWIYSTGATLSDAHQADAYLCVGSSPADWSAYSNSPSFTTLLAQPETSANPLPTGTCSA